MNECEVIENWIIGLLKEVDRGSYLNACPSTSSPGLVILIGAFLGWGIIDNPILMSEFVFAV